MAVSSSGVLPISCQVAMLSSRRFK
jgi:hypothetical protein